jgi:tellurite resistance protein TerC
MNRRPRLSPRRRSPLVNPRDAFEIFPFAHFWPVYAAFIAAVVAFLLADLILLHRRAHDVSVREAAITCSVMVLVSLGFCWGLWTYLKARLPHDPRLPEIVRLFGSPEALADERAIQFLLGYIVELSLSVDNLFVFVVIFQFLATPAPYRRRVLFYGILGAVVFRAIFIAIGTHLAQFHAVVMIFGAFLVYTGYKVAFGAEKKPDPSKSLVVRIVTRFLPVSNVPAGDRFFVRFGEPSRLYATPLFITLILVELTDIVFAVDSVPAVIGFAKDPFIVFTSNILAILGLRALFFLLQNAMDRFHLLKYGLAIVLAFVGVKMLWLDSLWADNRMLGIRISLGVVLGTLGASIVLSLMVKPKSAHHGGTPPAVPPST